MNYYKFHLFFILILISNSNLFANKTIVFTPNNNDLVIPASPISTAAPLGQIHGQIRYFFSTTQNALGLKSDFANALGLYAKYESVKKFGFQFAMSGYYVFNIGSSDLSKPDSTTKQFNRYELGLFEIDQPKNKDEMYKIEEFYARYNYKKSTFTIGQQIINTPFINPQDGRMRPTAIDGIWFQYRSPKKIELDMGWIYGVSPRSTSRFMTVGQSIGIYPSGIQSSGLKSNYTSNIYSEGIAIIGIKTFFDKNFEFQIWNLYVSSVFNTLMFQTDYKFFVKENSNYYFSLQCIQQKSIGNGGNIDPTKTYFEKGKNSLVLGSRIGWKNNNTDFSMNYTRIAADGKYLMPREWGKDPFFTFLPRERNEGLGDVNALVFKLSQNFPKINLKSSFGLGRYQLPDVKNYELNKYSMPSYTQLNFDLKYKFPKKLYHFEANTLLVAKFNNGNTYDNPKFYYNKVDMFLINFVLLYNF